MTTKELADLIFPNITKTIEDYEKEYPERNLKEGAKVTRYAPSPTGFMHIGNFYSVTIDYLLARQSGGVFYLRNEDTDSAREVEGAVEYIRHILEHYNMNPDEYEYRDNGKTAGIYGPYIQSERKEIYHAFIKHLIAEGKAYPCFLTQEEMDSIRQSQKEDKRRIGIYGRYAKYRNLSPDEAAERIKNGENELESTLRKAQFKNMVNFILDFYGLRDIEDAVTITCLKKWFDEQKPIGYKGMVNETHTSNELRLSSIEKYVLPICHISYNKDGYTRHCADYKAQKTWEKERNPERYKENCGQLFDRKNVAHSVRLLHMGIELAKTGKFNVDRTNIDRDFILNIRMGNTSYEEIIAYLEGKKDEMEKAMSESTLPEHIDVEFVNNLLLKIRKQQLGLNR